MTSSIFKRFETTYNPFNQLYKEERNNLIETPSCHLKISPWLKSSSD